MNGMSSCDSCNISSASGALKSGRLKSARIISHGAWPRATRISSAVSTRSNSGSNPPARRRPTSMRASNSESSTTNTRNGRFPSLVALG